MHARLASGALGTGQLLGGGHVHLQTARVRGRRRLQQHLLAVLLLHQVQLLVGLGREPQQIARARPEQQVVLDLVVVRWPALGGCCQ